MKDSLKSLLGMFPYFFKKDENSNFYKSQNITNNLLKDVYQALFDTGESFRLGKRVLVWKEQSEAYNYTIHFVANFPYLKTVTLYKNDTVIYTESFDYDDNVDSFNYSYTHSTLDDIVGNETPEIIPQDKFKIIAETYEEHCIKKGFPENDTIQGNEFDHDESLDEIGALHDIPRKQYIIVDEDLYPTTEPPYNDRLTEDDYHYMNRIIGYLYRLHTEPLPVAEIWKLYGIESKMENRQKLLLKVFDMNRHPNFYDPNSDGDGWYSGTYDEETGEIIPWQPKQWEHLDQFCDDRSLLGKYFFVKTSTRIPTKNQPVTLYFSFLNSLAEPLTGDFLVDIYLGETAIVTNCNTDTYILTADNIPQEETSTFTVIGKTSTGEIIGTEHITITVRGCTNADFYVSTNGSDDNDGRTSLTPFATIQKAVDKANGNQNLIAVITGDYTLTEPITINRSCSILGCTEVEIDNDHSNVFFRVPADTTLSLQDITLIYEENSAEITNMVVTNNNTDGSFSDVILDSGGIVLVPIQEVFEDYDYVVTNIKYLNNIISYTKKRVSEITKLSDLNNVVKDLTYDDGVISFDRFNSQSSHSDLDPSELASLNGILVGLKYEDGIVKYDEIST